MTPNSEPSVKELAEELLESHQHYQTAREGLGAYAGTEHELDQACGRWYTEFRAACVQYAPTITEAYLSLLKEHQVQAEALRAVEDFLYNEFMTQEQERKFNNYREMMLRRIKANAYKPLATTEPTLNTAENGESEMEKAWNSVMAAERAAKGESE